MTRPTELCQLVADWNGVVPFGGMLSDEKRDGWRAPRFPGLRDETRLWTRGGFVIEGTEHILADLDVMEQAAGERMMFDGEFQVGNSLEATKRWCERDWKLGGTAGVYHIFDAIPLADWRAGACEMPLAQRRARLSGLLAALPRQSPVIPVVSAWVADHAEAVAFVKQVWSEGGEGAVLKHADSPYQRKRNGHWMRAKRENMAKWSAER